MGGLTSNHCNIITYPYPETGSNIIFPYPKESKSIGVEKDITNWRGGFGKSPPPLVTCTTGELVPQNDPNLTPLLCTHIRSPGVSVSQERGYPPVPEVTSPGTWI